MAGGDPVAGLASRTRSDFAIAREWAFLDNAYIPPLPRAVKEAALEWYERRASEQIDVFDLLRTVSEVRQSFRASSMRRRRRSGFCTPRAKQRIS